MKNFKFISYLFIGTLFVSSSLGSFAASSSSVVSSPSAGAGDETQRLGAEEDFYGLSERMCAHSCDSLLEFLSQKEFAQHGGHLGPLANLINWTCHVFNLDTSRGRLSSALQSMRSPLRLEGQLFMFNPIFSVGLRDLHRHALKSNRPELAKMIEHLLKNCEEDRCRWSQDAKGSWVDRHRHMARVSGQVDEAVYAAQFKDIAQECVDEFRASLLCCAGDSAIYTTSFGFSGHALRLHFAFLGEVDHKVTMVDPYTGATRSGYRSVPTVKLSMFNNSTRPQEFLLDSNHCLAHTDLLLQALFSHDGETFGRRFGNFLRHCNLNALTSHEPSEKMQAGYCAVYNTIEGSSSILAEMCPEYARAYRRSLQHACYNALKLHKMQHAPMLQRQDPGLLKVIDVLLSECRSRMLQIPSPEELRTLLTGSLEDTQKEYRSFLLQRDCAREEARCQAEEARYREDHNGESFFMIRMFPFQLQISSLDDEALVDLYLRTKLRHTSPERFSCELLASLSQEELREHALFCLSL